MYAIEAESIVKDLMEQEIPFEKMISRLKLNIISRTEDTLQFDLINAHPSLANALRRIMIAEVPTIAFHNVTIVENDTVFLDEYLAHRIGLIPIVASPSLFNFKDTDENSTINFSLNIKNTTKENICVYSDSIELLSEGLPSEVKLKPGVLICKMAPGNSVVMHLQAEKGIGKTHAKWSPVSICSYRLMPKIVIEKQFLGDDAVELQKCFSQGVIGIKNDLAYVENPRLEMVSREVFRHDKFKEHVKMYREDGWFCFTVESIALDPIYILKTDLKVLEEKCEKMKQNIFELDG